MQDILYKTEVYYTMDGSTPSKENGLRYEGTITLEESEAVVGIPLRVTAYWGGRKSVVITQTYFMLPHVYESFTVPVVALVAEPDDLYGYDHGMLVEGQLRDAYLEENGLSVADAQNHDPANYNLRERESERAVQEILSPMGEQLLNQDAGVRVHGG